jgi:hypothetical protein
MATNTSSSDGDMLVGPQAVVRRARSRALGSGLA